MPPQPQSQRSKSDQSARNSGNLGLGPGHRKAHPACARNSGIMLEQHRGPPLAHSRDLMLFPASKTCVKSVLCQCCSAAPSTNLSGPTGESIGEADQRPIDHHLHQPFGVSFTPQSLSTCSINDILGRPVLIDEDRYEYDPGRTLQGGEWHSVRGESSHKFAGCGDTSSLVPHPTSVFASFARMARQPEPQTCCHELIPFRSSPATLTNITTSPPA